MPRPRLVFMGSADFSVPVLDALIAAGHEIIAVYSQPPRPADRGQREKSSAVHAFAHRKGLDVRTPETFEDENEQAAFKALFKARGDDGADGSGRIFHHCQPPPHHAQGFHIPFGQPLTPTI